MTGPDHDRKAEELTAKAHDYHEQGEGQSAAVWAAVAQIHATLALAATALGTTAADGRAWTEVAGTRSRQEPLRRSRCHPRAGVAAFTGPGTPVASRRSPSTSASSCSATVEAAALS